MSKQRGDTNAHPLERLVRRTEFEDDGCWLWTGYRDRKGYGRINLNYHLVGTHRLGYELLVGEIPDGYELDHLCRTTACWRPEHLEPVTGYENILRGKTAARGY